MTKKIIVEIEIECTDETPIEYTYYDDDHNVVNEEVPESKQTEAKQRVEIALVKALKEFLTDQHNFNLNDILLEDEIYRLIEDEYLAEAIKPYYDWFIDKDLTFYTDEIETDFRITKVEEFSK